MLWGAAPGPLVQGVCGKAPDFLGTLLSAEDSTGNKDAPSTNPTPSQGPVAAVGVRTVSPTGGLSGSRVGSQPGFREEAWPTPG